MVNKYMIDNSHIECLKEKIISPIEELKNRNALEVFGPLSLSTDVPSWFRIVNNEKYNNFYINMYYGVKRIEECTTVDDLINQVKQWFDQLKDC